MTNSFVKYTLLILLFAGSFSVNAVAEVPGNTETIEIKVKGVCPMCQSRIELATYDIKGVKSAKWDLESEVLTVVVKKGKVTKEQIGEALAKAGHDNELKKAKAEAYKELPGCCKYNDGVKKHGDGNR